MASITYDNVPAEHGGNIFKDIKIWIHRGVPLRADWVRHVTENGGQVVNLEKDADYLIADHLKARDAPEGAYSWQLIQDSVKYGALQLGDRYLIGPHPDDARRLAAAKAPKGTRTAYTREDDGLLALRVLQNWDVRYGNKIYKALSDENPRHPWQSWRDRYVRKYQGLSLEELGKLAKYAPAQDTAELPLDQQVDGEKQATSSASKQHSPGLSERQPRRHPVAPQQDTVQTTHLPQAKVPVTRQAGLGRSPKLTHTTRVEDRKTSADREMELQSTVDVECGQFVNEEVAYEGDGAKSQFYGDLKDFARRTGRSVQLELRVPGHGSIELWDLMQSVFSQDVQPEAVDWAQAAADMDIEATDENSEKLCAYFEKNVAEFVRFMSTLEHTSKDSVDEGPADEISQRGDYAAEVPIDLTSHSREHATKHGPSTDRSKKRQKLVHETDTPNPGFQSAASQVLEEKSFAGTARRLFGARNLAEIRDSQEDTQAILRNPATPSKATGATLPVENSTRSRVTELKREETIADTTPSQQLREEHDSSPIVKRSIKDIDRGRREQSTSEEGLADEPELMARAGSAGRTTLSSGSPQHQPVPRKRKLPSSFDTNVRPPSPQPMPRASDQRPAMNGHGHVTPALSTIEDYMAYYESLGYPRSIVRKALRATTMTPGGPAAFAMEHLKQRNKDLPSDIAGVWTDQDDRALKFVMLLSHGGRSLEREGKDHRETMLLERARKKHARLRDKHGLQRMMLREKWLNAQ